MITSYKAALNYIHGRPRIKKEPPTKRMEHLMGKLKHPEAKLKCIHVAGTNGKGSCVAYLSNMLQAAGLTVGTFTSPFMIRFNERISVNNVPISDEAILKLVQKIKPVVDQIDQATPSLGPSEFEIICAMMFLYFQSHPVDIVIVEAGIGGRSDSTNVVHSRLSIITTIGMDHMRLLGDTEEQIADNKAGIIRPNRPCVIGKIKKGPREVIEKTAQKLQSPIFREGEDYRFIPQEQNQFDFMNSKFRIKNLTMKQIGSFEMEDAAIAIEAFLIYASNYLNQDQGKIAKAVRLGIAQARWIGRMELIQTNPPIMIDGAHNVPAIKKLFSAIRAPYSQWKDYHLTVIMGVFADKQYPEMFKIVNQIPNADIILTRFTANENRASADFTGLDVSGSDHVAFTSNWKLALKQAIDQELKSKNEQRLILVTGSLLFISEVRKLIKENEEKLK